MKHHITKAVALLLTMLMLLTSVPSTVLADAAEALTSEGAPLEGFAALLSGVVQGKAYNADNSAKASVTGNTVDAVNTKHPIVDDTLSPYEPYSTNDEDHPFLEGGAAWIDLSQVYYGAPATPNYPITKWSANTSVYNVTGTGEPYSCEGYPAHGKEIYSLPDLNLIDEYLWAEDTADVSKDYEEDGTYTWLTENGVVNSGGATVNGTAVDASLTGTLNAVVSKDGAGTSYVYNRYDAMQGKWGLTLDKNVQTVRWIPTYAGNYYGTTAPNNSGTFDLDNSLLYLSDTPYLYYSTEALDSTQIAISLLIGTKIQAESKVSDADDVGQTVVTDSGAWEFRWYTITDDAARPGISTDTLNNSMVPNVYISEPVLTDYTLTKNGGDIFTAVMTATDGTAGDGGNLDIKTKRQNALTAAGETTMTAGESLIDPIQNAAIENANNANFSTDSLYVDGSITGCIDFTNILPLTMGSVENGYTNGSQDVEYKIAQIRVDTKTDASVEGAKDSAARINYLYFGPGQSMIYTPQSTVGSDINAANWMYAQHDANIGDQNANDLKLNNANSYNQYFIANWTGYDSAYTNGWENGEAVSITNTPNNPQLITVDTYGNGKAELISYDDYYKATGKYFTRGSWDYGTNAVSNTSNKSGVWKCTYTNADGSETVKYYEAEYNEQDENHYVMVTIPVRKWIDVLGNSRKLSMTINMLEYGKQTDANGNGINPSFGIWGNSTGALGAGHSSIKLTTRFRHEDIIGIFGTGYYQVDNAENFKAAEVDRTLGDSTIYNTGSATTASWFDLLRSPYMLTHTVTAGSAQYGYGEEMVGYTYVSAIRFAVPVGAKFTVQNMKGDGNSAGLNMYSTSGAPVDAYDGGTGAQPEINISTLLEEKQAVAAASKNADGGYDYTYSTYNTNGINGTQRDGAAAYGPYLNTSHYTIYDLLDTEKLNSSGVNSHQQSRRGLEQQKIYGKVYKNQTSKQFPILAIPNKTVTYTSADTNFKSAFDATVDTSIFTASQNDDSNWNPAYGFTYGKDTNVMVYAGVHFKDTDEIWGLVGALSASGATQTGWILLADGTSFNTPEDRTWYFTSGGNEYGYLYDDNLTLEPDEDQYDYYLFESVSDMESVWGTSYDLRDHVRTALKNEWFYSNVGGNNANQFTNFQTATAKSTTEWADSSSAGQPGAFKDFVSNGTPILAYANEWGLDHATGGYAQIPELTVNAVNATDMQIAVNTKTTSGNWSLGMTRIFEKSIPLVASDYDSPGTYQYPVFYYDYSAVDFSSSQTSAFGILVKATYSTYDAKGNALAAGTTSVASDTWYLDAEGNLDRTGVLQDAGDGGVAGDKSVNSVWGYCNMQSLMEYYAPKDADGNILRNTSNDKIYWPTIEIVGFNMYFSLGEALKDGNPDVNDMEVTIRRMEIRQVETTWLDDINYEKRDVDGETVMADSMNIINDAFYAVHDETADGEYILTAETDADGNRISYEVSTNTINDVTYDGVANSYRKANSNKGWSARIMTDTDKNGIVGDSGDVVYTGADGTSKENVYEYRTALGHLRVWVPGGQQASVVFEADRSFNTENYRYLYYSYSVRDLETGIAAEEQAADYRGTGVGVAIKSQQNSSDAAYLEKDGTWYYYPTGTTEQVNAYWSTQGHDDLNFDTNMCAALDLSTLDGIDSINQFVFYLNSTKEANTYSEFYINYIYLSNVPPAGTVAQELVETQVQYYYLMDNTGGRYSARFPTIDNPTGQVTGYNTDNDRVNPVVVERGKRLSEGTYLNGDLLFGYGSLPDDTTTRVYDTSTGSDGYYEKTYDLTEDDVNAGVTTGSFKNIWFYMGTSDDDNDINDFYNYRDRERIGYETVDENGNEIIVNIPADGQANVYDMLWSYGRWFTGFGESGLNTMYISAGDKYGEEEMKDQVAGNLVRRYATENYVLLRSGIEPRLYTTYYDAKGGHFNYEGSSADTTGGIIQNINSYHITSSFVLSYFNWPKENGERIDPVKYGFTFAGWHMAGESADEYYQDSDEDLHLQKYTKKLITGVDYFQAQWKKDDLFLNSATEATDDYIQHSVKFNVEGKTRFTRTATIDSNYAIDIPELTQVANADGVQTIVGWKISSITNSENKAVTLDESIKDTVYHGGDNLIMAINSLKEDTDGNAVGYLGCDIVFEPVYASNANSEDFDYIVTITVSNAELWLMRDDGSLGNPANQNITVTKSGTTTTYTNVPRNIVLVAKPLSSAKTDNGYWQIPYNANDGTKYLLDKTNGTVVGINPEEYRFSAYGSMTLNYRSATDSPIASGVADENGAIVYSAPNTFTTQREMKFYSQFDLSAVEGAKVLAAGTLYTRSGANYNYLTSLKKNEDGTNDEEGSLREYMKLNESEFNVDGKKNETYDFSVGAFTVLSGGMRQIKASQANGSGQYYLMITEDNGNAVTYYTRAYAIYELNGVVYTAYSDVVTSASVAAKQS